MNKDTKNNNIDIIPFMKIAYTATALIVKAIKANMKFILLISIASIFFSIGSMMCTDNANADNPEKYPKNVNKNVYISYDIAKSIILPLLIARYAFEWKHNEDIKSKRRKIKAARILLLEVLDADLHYLRASLSNPLLILYFKNNPLMSKNDIISIVFEMSPEEMEIIAKHYNNIFTLSALLQESNIDAVAFCNYNKEIIKHDIDTVNKSINVVRSFIK